MDVTADSQHIVYRSRGVTLFDEGEPAPGEKRKRTRVSARIDRSHWEAEYDHRFVATRSIHNSNPKAKVFGNLDARFSQVEVERRHKAKMKTQPARDYFEMGGSKRYSKAEVTAAMTHGKWRLVDLIEYGSHDAVKVRAVCEGGFCDGPAKHFTAGEWLGAVIRPSCLKCKTSQRRNDDVEQMKRDVHLTHGAYSFVGFETTQRSDVEFLRRVVGRCNGPRCGGRTRLFLFAAWQTGSEGRLGCNKCTGRVRSQRARATRELREGEPCQLDLAANEMRAEESAA